MNDNAFYRTGDVALAAALALYYPVEAVDRVGPFQAQYVFQRDAQLDELVARYGQGELLVEPRAYAQLVHRLEAQYYGDLE